MQFFCIPFLGYAICGLNEILCIKSACETIQRLILNLPSRGYGKYTFFARLTQEELFSFPRHPVDKLLFDEFVCSDRVKRFCSYAKQDIGIAKKLRIHHL